MSEPAVEVVPADFERLPEGLGFTDSLQPSCRREPHGDLGIDYISSARQGQWIQANVEQVSVKRRFGFCSGGIYNSSGIVARFSGAFYVPDHDGMWKDGRRGDGVQQSIN